MHRKHLCRGLSLVELLVGTVVGLSVLASGVPLLLAHLTGQAQLTAEMRVTQELRAAADVMARDLRRAGHWRAAAAGVAPLPRRNAYRHVVPEPSAGVHDSLAYAYSRDDGPDNDRVDTDGINEAFGFDLHDGVVRSRVGGTLQALTDVGSVLITQLRITAHQVDISLGDRCHRTTPVVTEGCCRPHPDNPAHCKPARMLHGVGSIALAPVPALALGSAPRAGMLISQQCPELTVRGFQIELRGRLPDRPGTAAPEHTAHQTVVLRNDTIEEPACPA